MKFIGAFYNSVLMYCMEFIGIILLQRIYVLMRDILALFCISIFMYCMKCISILYQHIYGLYKIYQHYFVSAYLRTVKSILVLFCISIFMYCARYIGIFLYGRIYVIWIRSVLFSISIFMYYIYIKEV